MDSSKIFETLRNPFDIETHKKVFINYLECVITEDGVVHYATPSHQEFLIEIEMEKRKMTREEFIDFAIKQGWFPEDMALDLNAIMIWTDRIFGKPNSVQEKTLDILRKEGLLHDKEKSKKFSTNIF